MKGRGARSIRPAGWGPGVGETGWVTTDPRSVLDSDAPSFSSPESARPRRTEPRSTAGAPPATFLEPRLRPDQSADASIS